MANSESFYSFAALIIPVLVFGGAVSDRWVPKQPTEDGPESDPSGHTPRFLAFCVLMAMAFAAVAEIAAIGAAFTGRPSQVARVLVVVAVAGGTVLAAGAVTWPWQRHLDKRVFNAVRGVTIVVAVLLILPTFNAIGTNQPDASLRDLRSVLLAIDRHEASRLARLNKTDARTQALLRHALRERASRPRSALRRP